MRSDGEGKGEIENTSQHFSWAIIGWAALPLFEIKEQRREIYLVVEVGKWVTFHFLYLDIYLNGDFCRQLEIRGTAQ